MDIGGVIDTSRWSHRAAVENPLLNRQRLIGAGRHEHDVDHLLLDDLLDDSAKLRQAPIAELPGMRFGRPAGSADGRTIAPGRMDMG